MNRFRLNVSLAIALAATSGAAAAQDFLVRHAKVHSADARGTIADGDVRVRGGRITEIGSGLAPAPGETVVEAKGRPLTPGLFAGGTELGVEEVSQEATTVDHGYAPAKLTPADTVPMRPEFDVMRAFNPASILIPVTREEGYTFALIAPGGQGSGFVAGQGAIAVLDGRPRLELGGSRTLFVSLGGPAAASTGTSRAAQWMLLDEAAAEAAPGAVHADGDERVLSAAGRAAFARYLGAGRVAFSVSRVSDIRQVLAWSKAHNVRAVIVGGGQAAQVADELAAAKVPVLLSPFDSLPGSFDDLGVSMADAKRLDAAGVRIAFSTGEVHNARKNRQGAGIAVAYGLPWEAALRALTANPAEIFGQGTERGRIAVGLTADLVLWSGDPFELDTFADQVWIGGKAQSLRSRQDELRDRYLPEHPALPRAYPAGR
jgi:hypothetical protein